LYQFKQLNPVLISAVSEATVNFECDNRMPIGLTTHITTKISRPSHWQEHSYKFRTDVKRRPCNQAG